MKSRNVRILVAGLFLAVVVLACGLISGGIRLRHRPAIATWDELRAKLAMAVRSEEYRQGGRYLAKPGAAQALSPDQQEPVRYRLAVDFSHSLTPEQVEVMREHYGLPFSQLSRSQQNMLLGMPGYTAAYRENLRKRGSLVTVVRHTGGYQQLEWGYTGNDGKGVTYGMGLVCDRDVSVEAGIR